MKTLQNNSSNSVLFYTGGADVSDSVKVKFSQLGGSGSVSITAISITGSDNFSVTYSILLGGNAIKNGLHKMEILNSSDEVLLTSTIKADGNTGVDKYMVLDDSIDSDFLIKQPSDVSFSSGFITFSNNNNA